MGSMGRKGCGAASSEAADSHNRRSVWGNNDDRRCLGLARGPATETVAFDFSVDVGTAGDSAVTG